MAEWGSPSRTDASTDARTGPASQPEEAPGPFHAGPSRAEPAETLSLVIPLYREAEHLDATLQQIVGVLESLGRPWELVLVDDGSPDDTWRAIERQCAAHPAIRGLRLSRNFGKEAA